jgi:hypothetical protein
MAGLKLSCASSAQFFNVAGLAPVVVLSLLIGVLYFVTPVWPLDVPIQDSLSAFPHPGTETVPVYLLIIVVIGVDALLIVASYFLAANSRRSSTDFASSRRSGHARLRGRSLCSSLKHRSTMSGGLAPTSMRDVGLTLGMRSARQ